MHTPGQEISQSRVHRPLAFKSTHAFEVRRHDLDGEVTLSAPIVAGMAAMRCTIVAHFKMRWIERFRQALCDFGGHLAG